MNLGFFLHITQGKQDKKGFYPIKAQLDCNGKRMQFTMPKLKLKPENWCNQTKRAKQDAPNSEYINLLLDRVQARFYTVQKEREQNKTFVSIKELKKLLLDKETPALNLSGMIDKFLECYEINEINADSTTYKAYKRRVEIFSAYFESEGIQMPTQIKRGMQDGLYRYILRNTTRKHNSALDVLFCCKTFLNFCLDNEWVEKNAFLRLKYTKEDVEKTCLEAHEIEAIRTLDLSKNVALQKTKDVFLLACATGLSYTDLANFSKEQIKNLERDYLHVKRQKTKIEGYVPLLNEAKEILQKYDYVLPVPKYRTYDNHIKKICKLANIQKKVSTHIGRKTFGDTMLNQHNVPLEVVSSMMCHSTIATTAKYYTTVKLEKVRKNTSHIK
jgi:site-specific recombinase XerD